MHIFANDKQGIGGGIAQAVVVVVELAQTPEDDLQKH